jgi:hypothetical protein
MRSVVALLLCALVLASSLLPQHDLAELGRLPRLLEHYRQHRQETAGLSFGQFLLLHYGGAGRQSHHAGHSPEHEGLPLHDCHHTPVPAICALPVVLVPPPMRARSWPTQVYKSAAAPRYPGGHAPTCWQPPCA